MTDADILHRAAQIIPGTEANAQLLDVRATLEKEHGSALIYEVVPPADGSTWIDQRVPRLSQYLIERDHGPIGDAAVRIAVWVETSLYLLTADAFFGFVADRRGVTLKALATELSNKIPRK